MDGWCIYGGGREEGGALLHLVIILNAYWYSVVIRAINLKKLEKHNRVSNALFHHALCCSDVYSGMNTVCFLLLTAIHKIPKYAQMRIYHKSNDRKWIALRTVLGTPQHITTKTVHKTTPYWVCVVACYPIRLSWSRILPSPSITVSSASRLSSKSTTEQSGSSSTRRGVPSTVRATITLGACILDIWATTKIIHTYQMSNNMWVHHVCWLHTSLDAFFMCRVQSKSTSRGRDTLLIAAASFQPSNRFVIVCDWQRYEQWLAVSNTLSR